MTPTFRIALIAGDGIGKEVLPEGLRVFSAAVAIFTIASILCGLSVNSPMLVAARLLQGVGAAMMMPVGRLTIIRTFPKSQLLAAMNFVIIPALIGPLLGPTVGGLIVHWLSWREIFFVNVPVGLVTWVICFWLAGFIIRRRPESEDAETAKE